MSIETQPTVYKGIVIVSPATCGGETKDQDRARFFGPGQVGCLCDGVTTSPQAAEGAELMVSLSPGFFEGDMGERLAMACDLLLARRAELQRTCPSVPSDMPEAMQTMLQQVARQKQAISYQTTMVAVRVRGDQTKVVVDILKCGDSAFVAFSNEGQLLSSSLQWPLGPGQDHAYPGRTEPKRFGPGDQVLVQVQGLLQDQETLAANSRIDPRHQANWVICRPVDVNSRHEAKDPDLPALMIQPDDRLLVPRYLYGRWLESQGQEYRCLDYSSAIRSMSPHQSPAFADGIEHRGPATAVLPDHFRSGHVESLEDQFPPGTHLVLCSDGFYSAFATASQMWAWLQDYSTVAKSSSQQETMLADLHGRLHAKSGDDDMSVVWMYPADGSDAIEGNPKGASHAL